MGVIDLASYVTKASLLNFAIESEGSSPKRKNLLKAVQDFGNYIQANRKCIQNTETVIATGRRSRLRLWNQRSIKL